MTNRYVLAAVLILQILCAAFFVSGIVATVLGLDVAPLDWRLVELIEVGAALGLILGIGSGPSRSVSRGRAQRALRRRSGWPRGRLWKSCTSISKIGR